MIIGCVGFSWSGSSAVTDLLSEYEENQIFRDEFIFAYHPDSISDLEFHLMEENAKFLSSTVSIPRFRKVCKLLLNRYTKGKIGKIVDEYINSLVQTSWVGDCQGQILLRNRFLYDYFGQRIMARRVLPRLPYKFSRRLLFYPLAKMEFAIQPDDFLEKTKKFTSNILETMGFNLKRNIVLDQPFPGNAPTRTMRYFEDSRAVIVDRDPRDLYVLVKHIFKNECYSVPFDTVDDFIVYYKKLHKTLKSEIENQNVLYINFESLIYDYSETIKKIESFLKISKHKYPQKYFDPHDSSANTQLFKKIRDYKDDIKKIEKELKEYLFPFENFPDLMFDIHNCKFFDTNPRTSGRKERNRK